MKLLIRAAAALLLASGCLVQAAQPRGVFAHFMVGNTESFTTQDWSSNMNKAASAGINAFALNMAQDWTHNEAALEMAMSAATSTGFKVLFSFDYAGGGPWDPAVVTRLIQKWGPSGAYWKHDGKPLVSTFEGPENATDWIQIKAATGCFFMPDWSSKGAFPAVGLAGGVADGLFSWAAWPWGSRKMDTYTDHSYTQALGGKPYMMAVSPWFYTNMPGYDKNWLWSGGNLWYERWQQVLDIKPDYVQIISWNDYGESHYVGPLDDRQYGAFTTGKAPFNYAKDLDHTGWLMHLPFMIKSYMNGNGDFQQESALVSHHLTASGSCSGGGTTGNTATQLQLEFPPELVSQDRLYIAALLTAPASLTVTGAGTSNVDADKWDIMPDGGVGLYYTSVPMSGPARYTIQLSRGGAVLNEFSTVVQQECFAGGLANWNARVTTSQWDNGYTKKVWTQQPPLSQRVCIKGWGPGNFANLCAFTCEMGYCPDSCVCENLGTQRQTPTPDYRVGYPKNGDANYAGLCAFACNLAHCYSEGCSFTQQPPYIPTVSPFNPDTCISGTGPDKFRELCEYGCEYGFCPRNVCTCNAAGPLKLPTPPVTEDIKPDVFFSLNDAGLCHWACTRGNCPTMCQLAMADPSGGILCPRDDIPIHGGGNCPELGIYDPFDFSWVKSYGAFGDSFAAGIGVGNLRPDVDAKACSRYSGGYPAKVQAVIQAQNFQFVACSGDTSKDILATQFAKLLPISSTFDLITMSAGGNDVGFSDVLKACLFLGPTIDKCNKALQTAEDLIDTTLESNVMDLLNALDKRLNPKGIVVWTLYGQFFDLSPDPCNQQEWCFLGKPCTHPTVDMRQSFNRLVQKANDVIVGALSKHNDGRTANRAYPVNWGEFVAQADGQFCEADSAGNYGDVSNYKLAFIRPSIDIYVPPERREAGREMIHSRSNVTTVPEWERFTIDDAISSPTLRNFHPKWKREGPSLTDDILKNFHPNNLGTGYQASMAINTIARAWEEINGISEQAYDESCPVPPNPTQQPDPPPPAYEKGTCSLHLNQYDTCEDETRDYRCEVTLYDNGKNQIGHGPEGLCSALYPMGVTSKLPLVLVMTSEHTNDYVQFNYGGYGWKSSDKASCSVGGWDPRQDTCDDLGSNPGGRRKRQMDCTFPC